MLDDRQRVAFQQYLANQVETASPAKRLLMLQAQLLTDLRVAEAAFEDRAIESIHRNLVHAQEIILVLRDTLSGSDWSGAEPLRAVYGFVHERLVACNVAKDRALLPECVRMIEQIYDANRRAASALGEGEPAAEPAEVGHG